MAVPAPRAERSSVAPPPASDTQVRESRAQVGALRHRFVAHRAERGACPDFAAVRRDRLPQVHARPGRAERDRHVERCAICTQRLRRWREEWISRGEWALACSRVGAHHARVLGLRALSATGRLLARSAAGTASAMRAYQRRRAARPRSTPAPPSFATAPPPAPDRAPTAPPVPVGELPPMIAVESAPGLPELETLAEWVADLGLAVVPVDRIEEVYDDADFDAVRAVVLTRPRPLSEWPEALAGARRAAPDRIVVAVLPVPARRGPALSWQNRDDVLASPLTPERWRHALAPAASSAW